MRMRLFAVLGVMAVAATFAMSATCADSASGALPGDDALTCDQIYAQGMAETRRGQDARQQDIAARRAQSQANAALVTGAVMSGGAGGLAAQTAIEAQAMDSLAMGAKPQAPNARMDHLKTLWAQRQCVLPAAGETNAATPAAATSDDAMTCQEIAAELAPYAQQMMPNLGALNASNQQMLAYGIEKRNERMPAHAALGAAATAAALDPTGASKAAYVAAEAAQHAKERAEDQAFANSEVAQENRARQQTLVAQGQSLQSDAHFQHLWQLSQQKGCGRRQ
jgi:hypothetical protein